MEGLLMVPLAKRARPPMEVAAREVQACDRVAVVQALDEVL
jgi:hypothetical protein